jgi:membrane protein YdbS with pleckstrin-like domain
MKPYRFDAADSESGDEAPEMEYRQSSWAWGWPLIPWAVLIILQIYIAGDPIFTIMFFALAGIMTLPRYLRWRSTSYVVSSDGIRVAHQSMSGGQDFEVEFSEIISIETERGFLDRTLGYKTIEILLKDRGLAKLTFVPVDADIDDMIRRGLEEASE